MLTKRQKKALRTRLIKHKLAIGFALWLTALMLAGAVPWFAWLNMSLCVAALLVQWWRQAGPQKVPEPLAAPEASACDPVVEQLQAIHHQADVAVGALHLVLDDLRDVTIWCY